MFVDKAQKYVPSSVEVAQYWYKIIYVALTGLYCVIVPWFLQTFGSYGAGIF
jgi:hypothetical protein